MTENFSNLVKEIDKFRKHRVPNKMNSSPHKSTS